MLRVSSATKYYTLFLQLFSLDYYERQGAYLPVLAYFITLTRGLDVVFSPLMTCLTDLTVTKWGRRKPFLVVKQQPAARVRGPSDDDGQKRASAAAAQAETERTELQQLQHDLATAESRRISELELKLRVVETQASAAAAELIQARRETETELAAAKAEAELWAAKMARTNVSTKAAAARMLRAAEERAAEAASEANEIRSEILRATSDISSAAVKVTTVESHVCEVHERLSLVLKTEHEEMLRVREEAREAALAAGCVSSTSDRIKLELDEFRGQTEASILQSLEEKFSRRLEESIRAAISNDSPVTLNASVQELPRSAVPASVDINTAESGPASEVATSTRSDSVLEHNTLELAVQLGQAKCGWLRQDTGQLHQPTGGDGPSLTRGHRDTLL